MAGWAVWRALRERRHITLEWRDLAGCDGVYELDGDGRARITLATRLGRRERRAVLAHELVHDERRIVFDDDTPAGIVRKEEALVEAETVRRLVPVDELLELVARREVVTVEDLVDEFDVPPAIAERAVAVHRERIERLGELRRRAPNHPSLRRSVPPESQLADVEQVENDHGPHRRDSNGEHDDQVRAGDR